MMFSHNDRNGMLKLSPLEQNPVTESESILEEVRQRFHRSPYQELHDVKCGFQEGVLTLCGQVPSCFLKQVAQSMVFSMERVETIDNRLEVVER